MTKRDNSIHFNETSNTMGGINTPVSRENQAATDPIAGAVEGIMDNVQHAFQGDEQKERARTKRDNR